MSGNQAGLDDVIKVKIHTQGLVKGGEKDSINL